MSDNEKTQNPTVESEKKPNFLVRGAQKTRAFFGTTGGKVAGALGLTTVLGVITYRLGLQDGLAQPIRVTLDMLADEEAERLEIEASPEDAEVEVIEYDEFEDDVPEEVA